MQQLVWLKVPAATDDERKTEYYTKKKYCTENTRRHEMLSWDDKQTRKIFTTTSMVWAQCCRNLEQQIYNNWKTPKYAKTVDVSWHGN